MRIKAAVVRQAGEPYSIEEVELAEPKAHEMLVRIVASGMCGTDEGARQQHIPTPLPAVLGHEGCGIVEALGADVTGFEVGDKVGISFAYCGTCPQCMTGHPATCQNSFPLNFLGNQPDGTTRLSLPDGTPLATFFGQSSFAEYAVVNEAHCAKIDCTDEELPLVGPVCCGIQTGAGTVLNVFKAGFGDSIAVFGCGTVGLSAVMAARIAGCQQIIAVGGNDNSLKLALEIGATHTINRTQYEDLAAQVKEISGDGTTYAIDTTGVPEILMAALHGLAFGGSLVGLGGDTNLDVHTAPDLFIDCKKIIGSIEGDSIPKIFVPQLMDYYHQGRFPIDKLVKTYPFEQINEAAGASKRGECIKAVITM